MEGDLRMPIRILMSDYSMKGLKEFIKYDMSVTVLPYSNYEHLKDFNNYYKLFDKHVGTEFSDIAKAYAQYGIPKNNIYIVNPHEDSIELIKDLINKSSIIFLSGGDPQMFMSTCPDEIKEIIKNFDGIVMGASAGAMVMQDWFYMYDGVDDYIGYSYTKGLGMAPNYNLMVHFVGSENQLKAEMYNIYTPIIRLPDGDNIVLV